MAPKVSTLIPIRTENCLDITFTTLYHQTLEEWELVLVDDLYEDREDFVEMRIEQFGFDDKIKHVESKDRENEEDYNTTTCRNYNHGLEHVDGELVVVTHDWVTFGAETLERSWSVYQDNQNYVVKGVQDSPNWKEPALNNCGSGLKPVGWEEFIFPYVSVSKDLLDEIDGWDEELDKGRHRIDHETAIRLEQAGGMLMMDCDQKYSRVQPKEPRESTPDPRMEQKNIEYVRNKHNVNIRDIA